MSYPTTREEWWEICRGNAEFLRALTRNFHPAYQQRHLMAITAPLAERACEVVRRRIVRETTTDPVEDFDRFLNEENSLMPVLLNRVWFGVPKSADAHRLPGFGILCDLCSESTLLYDEDADKTAS